MTDETKPTNGTMQVKSGKMRMYLNDEWVDFGLPYIANDMRKIAKSAHGYAKILRKWANELDVLDKEGIKDFIEKLKYFYGASEKWMAQDCRVWYGWLNQIYQFRNIKTSEESNKENTNG